MIIKRSIRVIFIKNKKLINLYDIDAGKILIFKKEPYGKKSSFEYFLGYNDIIRSLCTKLFQMIGYVKHFKVNTNFLGRKIPKENASYKCLYMIILDSVIRVSKRYYSQIILEEYKYEIKKTNMENVINDLDLSSSDDETKNESDNET